MEYEMEDSSFHGDVPEFGAIFMANIETKKYEKRQLFGVYRATSDGVIDIMPHAFSSSRKKFYAQVRFTPIWICSPLSESQFKDAISENYFLPKKFKFGLSEQQVRRLLQLFSTRKLKSVLPSRQLINDLHLSSNKVGRRIGCHRSSVNERSEMEYGLEDFSPSAIRKFTDYTVDNEGEGGIFGHDIMAHCGDGFLLKNRWVNCARSEKDTHRSSDWRLESGVDSLDIHINNERIPATSLNLFRGENVASNSNAFRSPDSAIASKFPREALYIRKRSEWPSFDGKSRPSPEDGRSLTDGRLKPEHDFDLVRADRQDNFNMHDVLHEENLLRARGINGIDKILKRERVLGVSRSDNHVRLGFLSENFGTPLETDKQRLCDDIGLESQAVDDYRFNGRTSMVNELDIGNVSRAGIMTEYNAFGQSNRCTSECLNMSFTDVRFADCNQNYNTYAPVVRDDTVRRALPGPPSVRGRCSLMAFGHTICSMKDTNPYLSEGDYQISSRNRTLEADISSRSHISDVGNKVPGHMYPDYKDCPAIEISDRINLRSASASEYRSMQFSPTGLGSAPLNSGLPIDLRTYGASGGARKFLSRQIPEDIANSCEHQTPTGNLTELDHQYQEYDPINHEPEWYNNIYSAPIFHDNREYSFPESACTDSEKQRESVFSRLTSRRHTQDDQEKDTDTTIDSSVDEVMEFLRQSQKSRFKKLKKIKQPVRQHDGGEMKKNVTVVPYDNSMGNSGLKRVPEKINEESKSTTDQSHYETLTETRAVEFRRRREKSGNMCEKRECMDLKNENVRSDGNTEPEITLDKQAKRRKLVRPVFNDVAGGFDLDEKPLSLLQTNDK